MYIGFFTSGIGLDIVIKVLKDAKGAKYSLFGQPGFFVIFI